MSEFEIKDASKAIYKDVCDYFDANGLSYDKDEAHLVVISKFSGDDLPVNMIIEVTEGLNLLSIISPMPFTVSEDKRIDVALAVVAANNGVRNGAFDLDLDSGRLVYKVCDLITDGKAGKDLLDYLFSISLNMIDDYNDKFFAVSFGAISVAEFIEWNKNK